MLLISCTVAAFLLGLIMRPKPKPESEMTAHIRKYYLRGGEK